MVPNRILKIFLFLSASIVQVRSQNFLLNFEGDQFKVDKTTGRLNVEPIQGFDLGDFSVLTAEDVPSGGASISSLETSLLRPCSPNHFIARIAQQTQDGTFDRGQDTGIRIALNDEGAPGFKSFDATSICLGIGFIPAITQGMPLPQPVGTDPLSKAVVPASGKITITGTRYQPPGSGVAETVKKTVTFEAKTPVDFANPTMFHTTDMIHVALPSTFTNLVLLHFKVSDAKVIGNVLGLPAALNELFEAGTVFESIGIDNFAGTKNLNP
ncbi:hypothetical protein TWF694_003813 [Orbilia ellipsospora]|uniref:IPT/TIG domain-containing protein n=1 Tax=Orbilia ellipsospora TaxID=2528407 RepID=A0AAV9WZ91_9PEZI